LHLVVLWGARHGRIQPAEEKTIQNIIRLRDAIARKTCQLQLGGGIRYQHQINYFFNLGIDYLIVGTSFLIPLLLEAGYTQGDLKRFYQLGGKIFNLEQEVPEFDLMENLDPATREKIIVAVDYRGEEVGLSGWEVTVPLLPEYCIENFMAKGYKNFLLTNIERDGTMDGLELEPIQRILQKVCYLPTSPNILIAGGISRQEDIELLSQLPSPPSGVIIGKALYHQRLDLNKLLARFPQR